jgi:AraC-like DNA-binding protein
MVGTARLHSHHAIQLLVAAEPFTLADGDGTRLSTRAAVIPPNVPHAVLTGASAALVALLDPRGYPGRCLITRFPGASTAPSWLPTQVMDLPTHGMGPSLPGVPSPPSRTDRSPQDPEPTVAPALTTVPPGHARSDEAAAALAVVAEWAGAVVAQGAPVHPALEEATVLIPTLLEAGPVRLDAVAAAVHMSASRLAHLFSAQIGLPFRPYVRWLRMRRAIESIAAGATLTDAAHAAGFTDGAHFTRVFRRTFGPAPSELATAIDWLP